MRRTPRLCIAAALFPLAASGAPRNVVMIVADVLEQYQARLSAFQRRTSDPWLLRWRYE